VAERGEKKVDVETKKKLEDRRQRNKCDYAYYGGNSREGYSPISMSGMQKKKKFFNETWGPGGKAESYLEKHQ